MFANSNFLNSHSPFDVSASVHVWMSMYHTAIEVKAVKPSTKFPEEEHDI